jgi:hypothetical protein
MREDSIAWDGVAEEFVEVEGFSVEKTHCDCGLEAANQNLIERRAQ